VVEVQHTIDTLLREGKQLALAADRPPSELSGLGPELTARLNGGLVCRIESPDGEVRRGILDYLATKLEAEIPSAVRDFVAANFTSHAWELSGALNRLQATSQALACKITLAMAEETLAEMIRQGSRPVRLADIEHAVCNVFGLEAKSLQSGAKARAVSQPRMLAARYVARPQTHAGGAQRDRPALWPPQPQHGDLRAAEGRRLDGRARLARFGGPEMDRGGGGEAGGGLSEGGVAPRTFSLYPGTPRARLIDCCYILACL
jgi:hypothetical protein